MTLQAAILKAGYKPQRYSGRMMNGKDCLATQVASVGDLYKLGILVGGILFHDFERGSELPEFELPQIDTYGMQIMAYWPSTPYIDVEQELATQQEPVQTYCSYPDCKCIVSTSTTNPVPKCPLGFE